MVYHWEACATKNFLGDNLIHGEGAAVNITAHVTISKNLKEPLKRAVFSGWAMKNGENDVRLNFSQGVCEFVVEFNARDAFKIIFQRCNDTLRATSRNICLSRVPAIDDGYSKLLHGKPAPA